MNNKACAVIYKAEDVKKAVHSLKKNLNCVKLCFEIKTLYANLSFC